MDKEKKKRAARLCAAVFLGLMGLYLAIVLVPLVSDLAGGLVAVLFLLFFVGIIGAVIWGVLAALRQRLDEIDSGEEEEAKKY